VANFVLYFFSFLDFRYPQWWRRSVSQLLVRTYWTTNRPVTLDNGLALIRTATTTYDNKNNVSSTFTSIPILNYPQFLYSSTDYIWHHWFSTAIYSRYLIIASHYVQLYSFYYYLKTQNQENTVHSPSILQDLTHNIWLTIISTSRKISNYLLVHLPYNQALITEFRL